MGIRVSNFQVYWMETDVTYVQMTTKEIQSRVQYSRNIWSAHTLMQQVICYHRCILSWKIVALQRRINIELGDSDCKEGTTLVEPCMKGYAGSHHTCNNIDNNIGNGQGNGIQGRILSLKLRDNLQSLRVEVWDRKKVWTVCASN